MLEIPSLEFQAGKIYAVVGPNGAGKTTLLNLLNLLEEPDKGKIFLGEQEIANSAFSCLDTRRKMGMIMENPLLFRTTVSKNIAYGLKVRSVDKKMWPEKIAAALQMVGLEGFEKRVAQTLSRGETQRVAIARVLVYEPEILLLDEPFANIDKANIDVIERLIETINRKQGTTIIFTTHDLVQAYRLSDKVISVLGGKIINGSLENFFTGEIKEADGAKWAWLSPSVKVAVTTEKIGKVHISIAPQEIILSGNRLQSSARNSFKGIITKMQLEKETVRVSVDAGVEFIALITRKSFDEMGLSIGSPVFLTFKSTSVAIF